MKSPFATYEHGDIIFFDTLEAMGGLRGSVRRNFTLSKNIQFVLIA